MSYNTIISQEVMDLYVAYNGLQNHALQVIDSAKTQLQGIEKELTQLKPEGLGSFQGRKIVVITQGLTAGTNTKIDKLLTLQAALDTLAEEFFSTIKNFRTILQPQIIPVNEMIKKLRTQSSSYLNEQREILISATKFER